MSAFSDSAINKFIALGLIVSIMITYILSGVFHFSLPSSMDTIIGMAIGYATHALGVVNGVAASNKSDTASTTAAATAAAMNAVSKSSSDKSGGGATDARG